MVTVFAIIVLCFCIHVHADRLVWSDDFNGASGQLPDSSKWKFDIGGGGWGNQELEYYTNSATNSAIDGNGNLVITARRENDNNYNCWWSGGDGLTSTYHLPNNQPFGDDFHIYRADWSSNSISFSVDGHQYATKTPGDIPGKKWVFDHNFFIIMNVAVGGGWPGPPDSSTVFPQSMVIDYVKVFSKDGVRHGPIKCINDRCIDIFENEATVQLNDCTSAKMWTIENDGSIRVFDKCLDTSADGTMNGSSVRLSECNDSKSQKWTVSTLGDIVNRNKCLGTTEETTGSFLQLMDCNGSLNQKWTLPQEM